MKFYINFKTFEENFYNNWAENKTGVVNYYREEDKTYFYFKWIWDYILVMTNDEIVSIMDYNDSSVQYNSFIDYFNAFVGKYFKHAIKVIPENIINQKVIRFE